MREIRRADAITLALAMLHPARVVGLLLAGYIGLTAITTSSFLSLPYIIGLGVLGIGLGAYTVTVREEFRQKRFKNPEHRQLWELIRDRLNRFRAALNRAPDPIRNGLHEMPKTIERTARHLYVSLRKADLVKQEINRSEGKFGISAMPFRMTSEDRQTSEMYMLADKNVAEYRKYYEAVIARVTRTEGQCAVFVSALDSLRVQLLAYRLGSDEAELSREDFLSTMAEVKGQLESINRALDELDIPIIRSLAERGTHAEEAQAVQTEEHQQNQTSGSG